MVKMDLGSSNAQSSSTATVTSNHIAAYQGLIASLQGFSGTADLKGAAYDSAKTYASSVLVPLLQGAILLSEKIASSTAKLPSEYSNQVAPESLDSADLERQIATYTAAYNRANEWLTQEMKRDVVDDRNVLQAQKAMARHLAKKHELEEKLRKLLAFNNTSASLFSEVDGLFQAVSQGMSQVKAGFSSFDGTFKVPAKSDMSWATTITSSWKKREKVIQALQHSGNLTKQDVEAVQAYITGGSFEGEETILIYDNYYGYAKYVISMSAIGEGDMSLKFNSSGLEGL
ncbi:T7SS effector LXG polymorphic toxin [Streptococcus caballi]|uniref:T7SS effector LXG polymorphic toxin n=1 Tax=Streptococcus caballi TaxID=439220 RepID=UPI00035DCF13|nr:T7SS effector LXG polymorphic toxin [Streptococcus caballi]